LSDKTEQPTAHRLKKARDDGDSGVSAFVSQAVGMLVAVALVPACVLALWSVASERVVNAAALASEPNPPTHAFVSQAVGDILRLTLPLLVAVGLASGGVSAVQAGGSFAVGKLVPDLSRLDPIAGLGRLFSLDRLTLLARALVGGGFVLWLTVRALRSGLADLARTTLRVSPALALAGDTALTLARDAAFVGVAMGLVDVLVTRRSWTKRLRMSKDEVKRERKDTEPDPHVKAARERAHHDMMASVVVAKVREASVVVVNPTHLACALRYDEKEGDSAPVVVASGRGDLAAKIVEAAQAYGIPVLRDVPLARALLELEVGDEIPEALYDAVAEILKAAWEER
jgi:flagellar biosynthesis protein FlhB